MSPLNDPFSVFAGIATLLKRELGTRVAAEPAARVGGGCINETWRWEGDAGPLFVKLAAPTRLAMLEAEAAGLTELSSARALRVPRPLAVGMTADCAVLALEWVDFASNQPQSETALGEQLAWQHRVLARDFGWSRDNTIGSTAQRNDTRADWPSFFRDLRLGPQLALAAENGHAALLAERGGRLLESLPAFFTSYRPVPSLLHGDLWGGNWGTDARGQPVVFDPAVYYGDREADIAMTKLFGGFGHRFYTAYHANWPLDQAAGARRGLYNLYHVLNHLNLFGGGYLAQAEEIIGRLLAELGR
ncbi:MAG TPA: fructosamine kinase family protein [Steroidobacteraceae bacterium]|nr:fructosamine kinase family protein [Steroidobacteraceae bacterium]